MYNYIAELIGVINNAGQNSTVIQIAGFLIVMLFIISVDLIINGLFSFFRMRERRK